MTNTPNSSAENRAEHGAEHELVQEQASSSKTKSASTSRAASKKNGSKAKESSAKSSTAKSAAPASKQASDLKSKAKATSSKDSAAPKATKAAKASSAMDASAADQTSEARENKNQAASKSASSAHKASKSGSTSSSKQSTSKSTSASKGTSDSDGAKATGSKSAAEQSRAGKGTADKASKAAKSGRSKAAADTRARRPADDDAEAPSLEELSAFISSLKNAKSSSQRQGDSHDEGHHDPADVRTTARSGAVAKGAKQSDGQDAGRRQHSSLNNRAEQKAVDKKSASGRLASDETEQALDLRSEGTPESGDQAPLSRREKRRLEWLEKRRQWRDQKKNERIQRRLDRDASGPDADADAGFDANDDAEDQQHRMQPESATAKQGAKQNEAPRQREAAPQGREQNADQSKPHSEKRDQRESRSTRGQRDTRDRRDARDSRDTRDQQDVRDQRDGRDQRDARDRRDARDQRDIQDQRESREQQETRASADPQEARDTRSSKSKGRRGKEQVEQSRRSDKHADQRTDRGDFEGQEATNTEQEIPGDDNRRQSNQQQRDKKQPRKGGRAAQHDESAVLAPLEGEKRRVLAPPKHYFVYKDPKGRPELSEECETMVQKVEDFLVQELLVQDGESILVGVSGGVDSIVLLDILHVLSFEHAYQLNIAHVNHGLRDKTSKRDEKFVKSVADEYDIACHTTQVKVGEFAKKHSLSEETAARELRYKFFRQTASTLRAQFCATAHNADDAAETLLMNLFRGTGLTGLAGIPPRRSLVKKTQLIRPLLCLSKQDILEYARQRSLEWYEDETNTMTKYTRNKVRHDLLPKLKEEYNPKIVESLNRTATLLRRADGFIDSLIDTTYHSVVNERDDSCVIDVHQLEALHSFLQGEIIERAISALTFGRTVSFGAIDRILKLVEAEVGAREAVVNNVIALRNRDDIVLMYEQHLQEIFLSLYKLGSYSIGKYHLELEECHRNDVRIGQDHHVEYFDYDALPYRLTLRTWHAGDSMHPIGFNGHMKISDILTNEKVEHSQRGHYVVLATATDIVWLCGMRMSEDFKITNETRRIVKATFRVEG